MLVIHWNFLFTSLPFKTAHTHRERDQISPQIDTFSVVFYSHSEFGHGLRIGDSRACQSESECGLEKIVAALLTRFVAHLMRQLNVLLPEISQRCVSICWVPPSTHARSQYALIMRYALSFFHSIVMGLVTPLPGNPNTFFLLQIQSTRTHTHTHLLAAGQPHLFISIPCISHDQV